MALIFIMAQVWAATESGNLEVTYTHKEDQVQDRTLVTILIVACLLCYYSLYCDPPFQLKPGANLATPVPQVFF
jgi:hypothetical protein